jgi:tetratricopeptide (TPR) repeat protein
MTPTDQLRDPALGHLRFAARLADDASSSTLRSRLAAAASEASGFAGWLALDLGDHTAARHHYNEAIKRAHQAERPVLAAYMLGSMSLWAAELGNGNEAVALSEQAYGLLPSSGRTPPAAEVWMALVDATARASRHDAKATQNALGRAEDIAERAHDAHEPVWPWVYPIDQAKIASYRGACYTKLKAPHPRHPGAAARARRPCRGTGQQAPRPAGVRPGHQPPARPRGRGSLPAGRRGARHRTGPQLPTGDPPRTRLPRPARPAPAR